jgi:hypothetical protein
MPKPWEQRPKEPDRWYGRFHAYYLLMGSERSVESAYRRFREEVESGGDPVDRRTRRKMPGSWQEACAKWEWTTRARAFDDDERRRVRKAHFEAVKKMNERHQIAYRAAFGKVIAAIGGMSFEGLSAPQIVAAMDKLAMGERTVMGAPIGIEITQKGSSPENDSAYDEATHEASAETAGRFEATPEMLAAVMRVLEAQEVKAYPDEAAAEPDAAGTALPEDGRPEGG